LRLYLIEERNIKLDLIVLSYTSNLLFAYLVSVYGLVGVLIGGNSIMSKEEKIEKIIERETARKIKEEIDDLIAVGTETTDFIIIDKDNWQQFWERYGVK
jgi:hypothetical protein